MKQIGLTKEVKDDPMRCYVDNQKMYKISIFFKLYQTSLVYNYSFKVTDRKKILLQ